MKKLILSITLLLATSIGYSQETTQPLQLTIKSDKKVYGLGDEISLEVEWKNIDKKDWVLLHEGLHDGLNLIIENENSERVRIFHTIEYKWAATKENFHLIKSGGNFRASIKGILKTPDIFNYPYKSQDDSKGLYLLDMRDSACYLTLGSYKIYYVYNNVKDFYWFGGKQNLVEGVWTGTLTSNTITIEVKERNDS